MVRLEKEAPVAPATYCTFPSTEVEIVESDCLTQAVNLVSRGEARKPTILNMANPDHPGGGFDNGRVAQEEDMFRRTTCVAATPGQFKTFLHKNETLRNLEQVSYPLDEFGIVYTENVEILRGEQDEGFPFLAKPISCNVIACAAYQASLGKRLAKEHKTAAGPTRQSEEMSGAPSFDSPSDMNAAGCLEFTPTYAVLTSLKLRSLLLVAKRHGCETLILSALGCGAFGNPAQHVAFIFREVLTEFAGAFKKIYFAIKGGNNFRVFNRMFENSRILMPSVQKERIFQADQSLELLTDEIEKKLCRFGGLCRDAWQLGCMASGCSESYHPPVCSCDCFPRAGKLQRWHCELYTHKTLCPRGALCSQIEARRHSLVARHEVVRCPEWSRCPNRNVEHERQFTHPPLCEKMTGSIIPAACQENREHMQQFRHPDPVGECHQTVCLQWMDQQHLQTHHTSGGRPKRVKEVCPFIYCGRKRNPEHILEYLHVIVPRCGTPSCKSLDPDHLDSFVHANAKRRLDRICKHGRRCKEDSMDHHRDYRHEAVSLKPILCPAYPLRPFNTFIDFRKPQGRVLNTKWLSTC